MVGDKRRALTGNARSITNLRKIQGTAYPYECSLLFDSCGSDLHVVVVLQSLLDQALQDGILEQLPPAEVGNRVCLRRSICVVRIRRSDDRASIVWPHFATRQHQ